MSPCHFPVSAQILDTGEKRGETLLGPQVPRFGYRFGYTHQFGSFTPNYAKLRWIKDLGLRSITVVYAYLS